MYWHYYSYAQWLLRPKLAEAVVLSTSDRFFTPKCFVRYAVTGSVTSVSFANKSNRRLLDNNRGSI